MSHTTMNAPNPSVTPTAQNYTSTRSDKLLLPGAGDGAGTGTGAPGTPSSTLASLFITPSSEIRHLPLVSPDYPQRENIASKFSSESLSANQKQMSLMVTTQVIEMTDGGFSSRRQPSLVPRPVKSGARNMGRPPPLPLISSEPTPKVTQSDFRTGKIRLNKFVRRLHDMLQAEKSSGIVEWRRGLLVLNSTDAFAKQILPKYFNTRNFKTFRRQLNYYGFVHVRSFSTTGSSTTALWVNRDLAKNGTEEISSVLKLRRVEPCEEAKTAEGRRHRKEMAIHTVEEDIGVNPKTLHLEQIRSMAMRSEGVIYSPPPASSTSYISIPVTPPIPVEVRVPTDVSSYNSSNISTHNYFSNDKTPGDTASTNAANVLLMLARS